MLEAVKQLEKLMEDFTAKYMDYDLSTWNYEELCKLEDRLHPFPLDKLKTKVYEALGEANAFFKVCGLLGLDYDITAKEIGFYINPWIIKDWKRIQKELKKNWKKLKN